MKPHIEAKSKRVPLLIMTGILLALILSALMMLSVRGGEFSLLSGKANMASVSQLAQAGAAPASSATAEAPLLPAPSNGSTVSGQEVWGKLQDYVGIGSSKKASGVNTAGAKCTGNSCQFANPLGQTGSLETFLNKMLDVVILLGSIAVVLSIIMAGLKYVTAQGDEGQIESAHKQLTWTVVGAGILLGAKVIAMVVQNTVKALS